MHKKFTSLFVALILAGALAACGTASAENTGSSGGTTSAAASSAAKSGTTEGSETTEGSSTKKEEASGSETTAAKGEEETQAVTAVTASGGMIDVSDLFSERDLKQTADTTDAETLTVSDGQDISITKEGVYVISGSASNVTISVEVTDEEKVQLVLDGVSITNETKPCIYVKNADKVFVTTTGTESSLSVTGTFVADGETNTDAVIFAKDDLVLNGQGTLNISSTDNAISCKNDLKVTGGTYNISCSHSALEAKDSISVADGTLNITSCVDGLHAENDDDNSTGQIVLLAGTMNIKASDDAIHATTILQVNGGTYDITAAEGLEATVIQINDGQLSISASDDGINAAKKSDSYTPKVEFNGGYTKVVMGAGDTDGVDSNGDIIVNGGTIDVSGQSTFDFDGTGTVNGGTVIENGTETNTLTNQMMGGGMHGGGMRGGDMQGGADGTMPERPEGTDGSMPEGKGGDMNGGMFQRGGKGGRGMKPGTEE